MRLGIFGGSFDPVHNGHLLLAECCCAQAQLDRVLLMPAAHSPHKLLSPQASDADRVAMLQLAIVGRPEFAVSSIEIDRGGVSYTVGTLRELAAREPGAELFLLLGADSLADLPSWREPAAICELALPLAVHRAGWPEPNFDALRGVASAERIAQMRSHQVEMPATPVSSSAIRKQIADGGAWQEFVPPGVADYIAAQNLYGSI